MKYTQDQLNAAYALNLCTVSVSQIIDYDDVMIMEQEYEAILNNINLEQIPKDEALLKILKQLLDTITFFRIYDGDKKIIENEYQQKMKSAIWSAVPNIGMIVAGGNPVTMAISLASQIGIGYMNYRRQKTSIGLELEHSKWQLERTAIEQFNGLRRELFDTAWRLSDTYGFPDELRLTERQIKQYNSILMDGNIIRRYERLESIQDAFIAYPPFWYQLGNTANAIANGKMPMDQHLREYYRGKAKEFFLQYRELNQQGLLREDTIAASCALELVDLLNPQKDRRLIFELLNEAVKYSGHANDVMQLAAIAYLKLNAHKESEDLLRRLVNERYNTVLNAQLLSSIYVDSYIKSKSIESLQRYENLCHRVGSVYLYPLPKNTNATPERMEELFLDRQKEILFEKYSLVLRAFMQKYASRFFAIFPVPDPDFPVPEGYYLDGDSSVEIRKYELIRVLSNPTKAEDYKYRLHEAGVPYALLDLFNDMFDSLSFLDMMNESIKEDLFKYIDAAIVKNRDIIISINSKIENGTINSADMLSLQELQFSNFTGECFSHLNDELTKYVISRKEMQDIAIAEQNLSAFCSRENLPDLTMIYKNQLNGESAVVSEKHFKIALFGQDGISADQEHNNIKEMITIVKKYAGKVIKDPSQTVLFTDEDPRVERYFDANNTLKKDIRVKTQTIAILDNLKKKGDYDLIFTAYGIIPVHGNWVKQAIPYTAIKWDSDKRQWLIIDGRYEDPSVDYGELYDMIRELEKFAKKMPTDSQAAPIKLFGIELPIIIR